MSEYDHRSYEIIPLNSFDPDGIYAIILISYGKNIKTKVGMTRLKTLEICKDWIEKGIM